MDEAQEPLGDPRLFRTSGQSGARSGDVVGGSVILA